MVNGRSVPGNRWDLLDGLEPEQPPGVSVVVVHYQQQSELDRTLTALRRQTHPANRTEIIVVDDGSPEPPRVPDGVRLLRQADEGFRAAAARNLGASHATGEVICFLDADTTPEPDYLTRMSRLPALAPEAVVAGRRKHARFGGTPPDAPVEQAGPAAELPEPQWLLDAYRSSRNLLDADDRSYRYVIGAAMACSRWFFERVGGFDEQFRVYGGEDWEWVYRAWLSGAVLAHVPDAVAWHDGPDWAGRDLDDPDRRARKDAETLLLTNYIPVAGSRGRAVRGAATDVLIRLAGAPSPAAAYVCVDSLLAVLPEASVMVPDEFAELFAAEQRVTPAGPAPLSRVLIDVPHAVRVDGVAKELRHATETVGAGTVGTVCIGPIRVDSARARARRAAWGTEVFDTEQVDVELPALGADPGLAGYLGGWS
ncbi:glycosyltransferase family 2 protein [Actinoplanes sp. Pm04-4]|uniref:Glycosyltransferase family 2 protein n=1 Tax=Paractinoplanes pyxinae TaxID=2997416 RepID=A0ABT4BB20_9ACTN|nr:glycosyltransferase family 2 protein [Actinoplanes pyxinae]MCY1143719.1 glycosyltransferase family 2 protein [Actinoplanes pyxinae]